MCSNRIVGSGTDFQMQMDESFREESIRHYYDCFARCDREKLTDLLVEDFVFKSSFASYDDRDQMLDEIWPHVVKNKNRIEELEIYNLEDRAIARYRHAGSNAGSICELFKFVDQKIASVEVFMSTTMQKPT